MMLPMSEPTAAMSTEKSATAFRAACRVIPGGVNSPVRAFSAVGGEPRMIAKGAGPILTDIDGNELIDYVGSWGALILGHADKRVEAAVCKAASKGWTYGAPTELETQLAELVISRFPSIELIRFVNSGTEAVMSAVRLARGFTRRDKVIKFEGCYHGHADYLLVKAGSGAMTFGQPSSLGIPAGAAADTLVLPYNDIETARAAFEQHGSQLAAVLIEPIAGNMGLVPPAADFLETLRELCDESGALLIFDEVMTGFRVSPGGAQLINGITPDLTCLGKIIGGGLPAGAFGGRKEIMVQLAPLGPVYQAGTLSGNPLAMAAGVATLQVLGDAEVYRQLEAESDRLAEGFKLGAEKAGVPITAPRVASMGCVFFSADPVLDFRTAQQCDTHAFGRFFAAMLDRGIYLAPSQFECYFVSTSHTRELIDRTIEAAAEAFAIVAKEG
jgi:glutamate-1-semialdehyde 2,1-aminomutase